MDFETIKSKRKIVRARDAMMDLLQDTLFTTYNLGVLDNTILSSALGLLVQKGARAERTIKALEEEESNG